MDLINQAVIHKAFGEGKVINIENGYIIVLFSQGEKRFLYPSIFNQFLTMKDAACADFVKSEILLEESKVAEDAEKKRLQAMKQQEAFALAMVKEKKITKKAKSFPRANIAFKCNYCDGGKSSEQVGFNGVCSNAVIHNNIEVEKRTWCNDELCPCIHYHNGEIDRTTLDQKCCDGELVCYESQMLRDWRALAGIVRSGDRKNEPMKLQQVQKNSLCVLTTRDPASIETERYIFAVFLVDETYEGDNREEGYVSTKSKYRIKLSPNEAHKMLFWNYHANDNQSDIAAWNSGLHRYLDDAEAVQILRDVATLKIGTDDEELASEFLTHFITINGVDTNTVPEKNGALIQSGF